ncbi:MAG: glycoside hydrolase family 97 protein [Bacteroidales bacterium]|nr:glycoside hydrolase family 97 protein [Candidatus Cacconaster scatequi]
MKKILATFITLGLVAQAVTAENITVSSPDSRIKVTVSTDGTLGYSLSFKGRTLIDRSPLGFEFKGEEPMSDGFELVAPGEVTWHTDIWDPVVRNKHSHIELPYNETVLKLRESAKERRRMDIAVRVYNDGAAFRYTLYGSDCPGDRKITRELTQYRVPAGSYAWIGHNADGSFTGSQETQFIKTPVAEMTPEEVDLLPLLVEIDRDNWLALSDACLDNFPGWFAAGSKGSIISRLAPLPGEDENGVAARFFEKQDTPWRVIMVADNPGRFIESEMIRSLNPPCAIGDPSWIKPGMSAWDHWWSGEVKMEMPVIKEYIDLAAAQGWPYMLVDWQWYGPFDEPEADIVKNAPQIDMQEIIAYARERGVKIWVWIYSDDVNRNDAYKEAFATYEKWGVAGIKIDFMDRNDQEMVNWYRRIVKCAAEHHLMVNFHGAYRPDGIDRTWPNQVTREGVMGAEYAKWSGNITPSHNVTLAFTRMLAGAMDYTPGAFLNEAQGEHKQVSPASMMNTRCAELSKFVIYESPHTVFCDHPSNVLGQPGADFLSVVPTQWDDIRFIEGYPGEYVIIAKRSGDKWYLGVMNNEVPRDVTIDLGFTGKESVSIEYWADGKKADRTATDLTHKTVSAKTSKPLKVHLAAGGGYVAIITL